MEDFLDQVLPHFDFDYASGWEDICYKDGPIVSVKFFKNVVMPRYKRIQPKLQSARHRPLVDRLRRRRAPDPAAT